MFSTDLLLRVNPKMTVSLKYCLLMPERLNIFDLLFRRFAWAFFITTICLPLWLITPRAVLAADIIVNSTSDAQADNNECTLREAIINANNDDQSGSIDCRAGNDNNDTILFNIGSEQQTIQPMDALPTITEAVRILGTSQSGTSCDSWPPSLRIVLNGSNAGNASGLNIRGTDSLVQGLVINGFSSDGIVLWGTAQANKIQCNFIGTDVNGATAIGNRNGIFILGGANGNRVGMDGDGVSDRTERNLISGNIGNGVVISDTATTANLVAGNYIGADISGMTSVPNALDGVLIVSSPDNFVGTDENGESGVGEGNLISGNGGNGIQVSGNGATNNTIAGNIIGLAVSGDAALGNMQDGVKIRFGASNNIVGIDGDGVSDPRERNVISGNGDDGIHIAGGSTINNKIAGNYVGTDIFGTAAFGNSDNGIIIEEGSSGNIIGTDSDGVADDIERNLISGNGDDGVDISDSGTANNSVVGNYIGTDLSGAAALGNQDNGVRIENGASENRVGTNHDGIADAAEQNLISGNHRNGVAITGATSVNNKISANSIFANRELGVDLEVNGISTNDASDGDNGPNNIQNYPILTDVLVASESTTITGTIQSTPNTLFRIEFFANDVKKCDPSGHGEGESFLGAMMVTSDVLGEAIFTFKTSRVVSSPQAITATATDSGGNTSEFSDCGSLISVMVNLRSYLPLLIR